MLRKKPIKSEELAVKWVEFLAEHKELPNLEPAGNELNLMEYYLIDVILGLAGGLFLFGYIFLKLICGCCSLIYGRKSGSKKKKRLNRQDCATKIGTCVDYIG